MRPKSKVQFEGPLESKRSVNFSVGMLGTGVISSFKQESNA
jgi:hypothetical protein